MMKEGVHMNYNELKSMIETTSVSGYEIELGKKIMKAMRVHCDKVSGDESGSVCAYLNPDNEKRLLMCAHMDEIGYVVSHIEENGLLRVINSGGVRAKLLLGSHVRIMHDDHVVHGVVCVNKDVLEKDKLAVSDLLVDIGVDTYKEAIEMVSPGDCLVEDIDLHHIGKNRIVGRALDDRMGVYILMEAMRKAKDAGCQSGVVLAATSGEETTCRGAYFVSEKCHPNAALIVDVTYATDYPGSNPASSGHVKLGGGPVLCHSSTVNKALQNAMQQCAEKCGIHLQYEVSPGRTFTDGDKVHFSNEGVSQVLVSIPLRYMHSSVEMASISDIDDCINLIYEFLMIWDSIDLNPYHEL